MEPLRPIDPDEELPQEAADQPAANHSDVEPPADTQSTSAQELPPVDDELKLTDDPIGPESDSVALPPETSSRDANAGLGLSDRDAITLSSGTDRGLREAAPESAAAFFESAPEPANIDAGPNAEQKPAIEPVNVASLTDAIQPPGNSSSDASANHALLNDTWPESNAELAVALEQTPLPAIGFGNASAPPTSAAVEPAADRSSSRANQKGSREEGLDNRVKHDGEFVNEAKTCSSDAQPKPAPAERQAEKISRAELEAFLEKFDDYSSRTRALLSPAPDGGPPMARPIVLVSLAEEEMQAITNEALAESGSRLAKTAAEIAEDKVNEAFWLRDCEMRALYRGR